MMQSAQASANRQRCSRGFAPAALVLLTLLVGCAPESYPGDPLTEVDPTLETPSIVPLDPLLAQIAEARDADDPDPELRQRGEDLRSRVSPQPAEAAPVGTDAEFENRSADLRRRAEAVRNAPPE